MVPGHDLTVEGLADDRFIGADYNRRETSRIVLYPFAVRHIVKGRDGADETSLRITERCDVDAHDDARAIRTLDDHVLVSLATEKHHFGHGGFGVGQVAPVCAKQPKRATVPLPPEGRFVAPEFDGPPVVQPNETAGRLAHVESNRELRDQRLEIREVGLDVRDVSHYARIIAGLKLSGRRVSAR